MPTRAKRPLVKTARQAAELKRAVARFKDLFRAWGREGGEQRKKRLTPEQRREIARKAAMARWKKKSS